MGDVFQLNGQNGGGGGEEAVGECRFRAPPVSCEKRNARSISL